MNPKGGNKMGKLPEPDSGSISVDPSPVSMGDEITFTLTGIENLKNPRVWVTAHQDGKLVYGAGADPREPLKLGGGSSDWVSNGGGPAHCVAQLYYIPNKSGNGEWNGHGDQGESVVLGICEFEAV